MISLDEQTEMEIYGCMDILMRDHQLNLYEKDKEQLTKIIVLMNALYRRLFPQDADAMSLPYSKFIPKTNIAGEINE